LKPAEDNQSPRSCLALAALATLEQKTIILLISELKYFLMIGDSVVKGQVLDPSGEPVIGATVKVKGSKTGTVTDLDGNFLLSAAPGAMVEVSYIGYKTTTGKSCIRSWNYSNV